MTDTLYVPELTHNLISVKELCNKGCRVVFEDETCKVTKDNKVIIEANLQDELYMAKTLVSKTTLKYRDLEY